MRAVLICLLLGSGSGALAQTPCPPASNEWRGELQTVQRQHPNGQALFGYVLRLSAARCASIDGADVRFRTIHLVPRDGATGRELRAATNRLVTVRGASLMEAHTAYHLGDVVLMEAALLGTEAPRVR